MYEQEIQHLKAQLKQLQETKESLDKQILNATDPIVRKVLIEDRSDVIDQIDETKIELEKYQNLKKGSSNGHDKDMEDSYWDDLSNNPFGSDGTTPN